jgi:glutamine synthetase
MATPKDVLKMIEDHELKMVDVKFTDLFGQWQHFSMPVEEFSEEGAFVEGMGFDGSSIRGFQSIESSDMILLADPDSAMIDPVCASADLEPDRRRVRPHHARTLQPRPALRRPKAVEYLQGTGIADTVYIGPEAEFFVFDKVMFSAGEYSAAYQVDSIEGPWNNGIFGFGHSVPTSEATSRCPRWTPCRICARRWCAP